MTDPASAGAAPELQIEQKLADKGCILLTLTGPIDANTYAALTNAVKALFQQKYFRIILDCSRLSYISSAGIGAVINLMTEAQSNRGNVVLMEVSPETERTLRLFGLQEVLPVALDKQSALSHFT